MAYPQVPQAPTGGLDPRLFQQQAQGMAAQDELQGMRNSLAEQQAYAQANAPMRGVTGSGYSASGPTILDAFATLAQRNTGNKNIQAMKDQAAALRGDVTKGRMAEMEAAQAQKMQNFEQNRLMAQEARDARSKAIRGTYETWSDGQGNEINVAMTDNGPVNSQGELTNLQGFKRAREIPKTEFVDMVKRLPSTTQKDTLKSYNALGTLADISSTAQTFEPSDYESLNKAALDVAVKAATPAEFENYVFTNLKDVSPKVKAYLESIYAYSAQRRKDLSGSALTRMEKALSDMFLPSANGSNFSDTMRRIDREAKDHYRTLGNIDQLYGTKITDRAPVYQSWNETDAAKNYIPPPPESAAKQLGLDKVLPFGLGETETADSLASKAQKLRQELGL